MANNYTAFTIRAKRGTFTEIKIPMQVLTSNVEQEIRQIPVKACAAMALWDTGATMSGITKNLAERLELKPFGMTSITTAGGVVTDVPVYKINCKLASGVPINFPSNVSLELVNDVQIFNIAVTELPNTGSFDFLVGMDIITLGDFSITNKDACSCISFRIPPDPIFHIDYVACLTSDKKGKNQEKRLRKKQKR
jgi:hypothetical protein